MRSAIPFAILPFAVLMSPLCAQTAPTPSASIPVDVVEITPDTVVATVNGKKFTSGELEKIVPNLPAADRDLLATQPEEFLKELALSRALESDAEKRKLQDYFPWKERIEAARRQILGQAAVQETGRAFKIDPAEVLKIFESRKGGYQQAETKVLFISKMTYEATLDGKPAKKSTPEQAKAKLEAAKKDLLAGKDFVEAAKLYSDDPDTAAKGADFPYPIRANSTNVPENIRVAVVAGKVGDLVGPIEHEAGWYFFRIEKTGVANLDSVKAEIEKELRDAEMKRYLDEARKKSTATLDHKGFWDAFLSANKQAQERREKQAQGK